VNRERYRRSIAGLCRLEHGLGARDMRFVIELSLSPSPARLIACDRAGLWAVDGADHGQYPRNYADFEHAADAAGTGNRSRREPKMGRDRGCRVSPFERPLSLIS
jgi:hypothetical protein